MITSYLSTWRIVHSTLTRNKEIRYWYCVTCLRIRQKEGIKRCASRSQMNKTANENTLENILNFELFQLKANLFLSQSSCRCWCYCYRYIYICIKLNFSIQIHFTFAEKLFTSLKYLCMYVYALCISIHSFALLNIHTCDVIEMIWRWKTKLLIRSQSQLYRYICHLATQRGTEKITAIQEENEDERRIVDRKVKITTKWIQRRIRWKILWINSIYTYLLT